MWWEKRRGRGVCRFRVSDQGFEVFSLISSASNQEPKNITWSACLLAQGLPARLRVTAWRFRRTCAGSVLQAVGGTAPGSKYASCSLVSFCCSLAGNCRLTLTRTLLGKLEGAVGSVGPAIWAGVGNQVRQRSVTRFLRDSTATTGLQRKS